MSSPLRTPVVFIIFNRPDLAEATFSEIARAKPSKLLVIADGPRTHVAGENLRCAQTRKLLERVDWDCQVLTNFSGPNLGCKKRVSSGLDWAFEQVEEAIILEDDCVPDPSFFRFCDELLEKYRNDNRVMAIGGTNLLKGEHTVSSSYYFSSTPLVWGWASWRRAWKHYEVTMADWPSFRNSGRLSEIIRPPLARAQWRRRMEKTFRGAVDTWDYQWTFAVWKQQGLVILPDRNLITNIGFGPGATHTHEPTENANLIRSSLRFPLAHPSEIGIDSKADQTYFLAQGNLKTLWTALMRKLTSR